MHPATTEGAEHTTFETDDDLITEFLKRHNITDESEDAKRPPEDSSVDDIKEDQESEDTEDNESEESEDTEDTEDNEETEDKPSKKVILDPDVDAYVKHKVDGKDVEIKVSDLTRLYGQEAALTRKSQEVAELRKRNEAEATRYATGLETMLNRAKERWEPYSKINWVALTKDPNVSQDELVALHSEAQKVWDDVVFYEQSLDGLVKQTEQQRHEELLTQAKETWKTLSDPDTGIKGWNEQMYKDVHSFAVSEGIPETTMATLVDPAAYKILHKAMLYTKGQQAAKQTKRIDKTPKRIIKDTAEPLKKSIKASDKSRAEDRFKKSGNIEDGVEALLAKWERESN